MKAMDKVQRKNITTANGTSSSEPYRAESNLKKIGRIKELREADNTGHEPVSTGNRKACF